NSYWAIGSIAAYIVLVTYLARDEVKGNSSTRIRVFFAGLCLWFGLWLGFAASHYSYVSFILLAVSLFHLRMLSIPLKKLRSEPGTPTATGKTIGTLLRTLPLVDVVGILGAAVFWPWALLGLAWMLPGPFLA